MENGIYFGGIKIEFTPDQVTQMREALKANDREGANGIMLSEIPVGDTFTLCNYEFIVLEHFECGGTAVCFEELVRDSEKFGSNNNYNGSNVDEICNEIADELTDNLGTDNIFLYELDLTSDDGLDDYGTVDRKVMLMTTELYRKYVRILDKYKPGKWWWLATPWSTATHNDTDFIKFVSPSGCVLNDNYRNLVGVRPFCILKSNIFVSR